MDEQEQRQMADDAASWASKAGVEEIREYLSRRHVQQVAELRPTTVRVFMAAQRLLNLLEQKGSS